MTGVDTMPRAGIDFPKNDPTDLTDSQIAEHALDVAQAAFDALVAADLTCGPEGPDHLHVTVGVREDDAYTVWAERVFGAGAGEKFAANTGPNGKGGTSAKHRMNSGSAARLYQIPGDTPKGWTGGAYVDVVIKYKDGSYGGDINSVADASGVQGALDRVVSTTAANVVLSLCELREVGRQQRKLAGGGDN